MTNIVELVAFFVLIYMCFDASSRLKSLEYRFKLLPDLEAFRTQIADLKVQVSELEWRMLPEEEKKRLRFEKLAEFTLANVKKLKQGDTTTLSSKSWIYPSGVPLFDQFEYKHEAIDTEAEQWGFVVRGFRRSSTDEGWKPFLFYAKDDECSTRGCDGTIKQGRVDSRW